MASITYDPRQPREQTRSSRVEGNREGIWGEETTQEGLRKVVFRRPLPMQLIRDYVAMAIRNATTREFETEWFAEIVGFHGVWAKAASQKEALDELEEVLFEWVLLKIRDNDRDLPVLNSLDLNGL